MAFTAFILAKADSLSWLETLEAQTSWQSRVQRHKYSSRTLIQAVFFRFTLGSASKIGKAFQLALSVGIPGLDLRTFASQASLPSKTTLSRGSVYLDMSSLLLWQKKWQQDEYVMFMWADSSPQSGRDWLMSMAAMCRVRKKLPSGGPSAQWGRMYAVLMEEPCLCEVLSGAMLDDDGTVRVAGVDGLTESTARLEFLYAALRELQQHHKLYQELDPAFRCPWPP